LATVDWQDASVNSGSGSSHISLDDLYVMTAHMYSHRNEERAVSATFAHFVEVCAALTTQARQKRRESLDFPGTLCKALGWFFPLMAKLNVRSVEELIYRKYPGVCPYCRAAPHNEAECKLVKGTEATVDHAALRQKYRENASDRPVTLDDWREMFARIYPRQVADAHSGRSVVGLFEELGELAEAVRVYQRYPKYLAGEAADVFSYLMALATEYSLQEDIAGRPKFSLHTEYLRRYPGICRQCGYHVCICPPLPAATIGRMAKELDLDDSELIFVAHSEDSSERAARVAERAVAELGGYRTLLSLDSDFPFDRGDANRSLVNLCLRVSEVMEESDAAAAESLRSAAIRIASFESAPGTVPHESLVAEAMAAVRNVPGAVEAIETNPPLSVIAEEGGRLNTGRWRVLFASATPVDEQTLRVDREVREVVEAVKRSSGRDSIEIEFCQATQISDLRRALLDRDFDLLLISGHGEVDGPLLQDADGESVVLSIDKLQQMVALSTSIQCVVLNCCYSAISVSEELAPVVVAMFDEVDDDVAIGFTKGFFDALGAGKSIDRCIQEGQLAVSTELEGADLPLVVLKR
jgi:NTP pyrophosphatase (non-canonical NTP hydrolase)